MAFEKAKEDSTCGVDLGTIVKALACKVLRKGGDSVWEEDLLMLSPIQCDCRVSNATQALQVAVQTLPESSSHATSATLDTRNAQILLCAAAILAHSYDESKDCHDPTGNRMRLETLRRVLLELMMLPEAAFLNWRWFFTECTSDLACLIVKHVPQNESSRPLLYAKAAFLLQSLQYTRNGIAPDHVVKLFRPHPDKQKDTVVSTGRTCDIFDGGGLWERLGQDVDDDDANHKGAVRRMGIPMNHAGQIATLEFPSTKKCVFLNEASLCAAAMQDARERIECVQAYNQLLAIPGALSRHERRQSWLPADMMFAVILRKQARLVPKWLRKSATSPEGRLWVLEERKWAMALLLTVVCLVSLIGAAFMDGSVWLSSLALAALTAMGSQSSWREFLMHGRVRVPDDHNDDRVGRALGDTPDQVVYSCFQDGTNAFREHYTWSGDTAPGGVLECPGLRASLLKPTERWGNILVTADGEPLRLVRQQDDGASKVAKAERLQNRYCVYQELKDIEWIR